MEILDNKSNEINSFFTALDEMLDVIGKALKNRTPHLAGLAGYGQNSVYSD